MKIRIALGLLALAGTLAPQPSLAVDAAAVDKCHQAIALGLTAVSRGRIAVVARCFKYLDYEDCMATDQHTIAHENELRNFIAGDNSACRTAIDSGATLADFGPLSCSDEWAECGTEVPSISTLEDLAECFVCQERGFDLELRHEIGLPRPTPTDLDERRCTRSLWKLVTYTARKSVYDVAACAKGSTKPFDCPVDSNEETRFGRSLAKIATKVEKCGVDEGRAPGALTSMCEGDATDGASLATCFENVAKCIACRQSNSAYEQSQDCAAFSGFSRCDGMF